MEWISVEDRLPERGGTYLVYCVDNRIRLRNYCEKHPSWYPLNATHWMPLPDPPEQDELSEILDVLSNLEAYQEAIAQQMAGQICEGITEVLSGHVKEIVAAAIKEAVK